jgi:quercetin dioxygenase-like cupin family protein
MSSFRSARRLGVVLGCFVAVRLAGAQAEPVTFYDFAKMPATPFGPMQLRAVIAESNSVAVAEVPAGMRNPTHHHQHEQIWVGLTGSMDYSIGGVSHPLEPLTAAIPPSNVEHYFTNHGGGTAEILEFQPLRRPDWLPPYPAFKIAQSPEPVSLPPDQRVSTDFALSSSGWRTSAGARSKSMTGRTVMVTFWDLSMPGASVNMGKEDARHERFAYVIEGPVEVAVGSNRRQVGARTLMAVAPTASRVQLRSTGQGHAILALFESR